jgi:hypothetical protein
MTGDESLRQLMLAMEPHLIRLHLLRQHENSAWGRLVKLADEDDPLLNSDVASPALERYREERAAMARLDRLEREGQLVARADVREGLGRVAAILRAAGDGLLQQYGPDAVDLLNEALSDAEREIERLFSDAPLAVVQTEEPAA